MTRYIKPFSKGELSAARSNGGSPIRPFPEAAAVTGTQGQTGGGGPMLGITISLKKSKKEVILLFLKVEFLSTYTPLPIPGS